MKPVDLARRLAPLLGLAVFGVAMWALRRELASFHYHDVLQQVRSIPADKIALAMLLTAVSYAVLVGYDALGLRYVKHPLGFRKTAFTSFIAFAFSQNLGFPWLTGGSVRLRLYSSFGLTGLEVASVAVFSGTTFWLGVLSISGTALAVAPAEASALLRLPLPVLRIIGLCFICVIVAYLGLTLLRRSTVSVRGLEIVLPEPRLVPMQVLVGAADWAVAATVLFVLLPGGHPAAYPAFLVVFVLAQVAGVISHVPAGLGVFESIVLVGLRSDVGSPAVLASLVVYRLTYYLLPLVIAVALIASYEVRQRRTAAERIVRATGTWISVVVPRLLAIATFLAGAVLLVTGAAPAVGSRLGWLDRVLPLGVIEFSHFLGSLLGLALLILAWGLYRRINAAYSLAVLVVAGGVLLALLRGLDFEEATLLALVLAALLPARRHFHRRASLLAEPLTGGWLMAIGAVVIVTVWLGLFAYHHVAYSSELWWRFTLDGDAPRFLRATVGVLVGAAAFAATRLLSPANPRPAPPTDDDLEHAAEILLRSPNAGAAIALLGDKALLFNDDRTAFVMYGVRGRSWIALGDPVGPLDVHEDLVWAFREIVDRSDGRTAFYQVAAESLSLYVDVGLDTVKLGEEARVPLGEFSLEGSGRKSLRRAQRSVEKEGCRFSIVPADELPPLMPQLRSVSDEWLAERKTREKGFSLGRFEPRYISRFPAAVVMQGERLVAFANIWVTAGKQELSVDLMRHSSEAPNGVMDYLFVELMLWGKAQGYAYFNLGMAPLSGFEFRRLAPLWNRFGALVFRHGEHFYNFQGLREYKDKFDPEWVPKYLASPGGLALPAVLTDVATLISGGLGGIVGR